MIKFIHPVEPSEAKGLVADVYAQIKRDFGRVAEPFMMHSPSPNLLAGAWMACRGCSGLVKKSNLFYMPITKHYL